MEGKGQIRFGNGSYTGEKHECGAGLSAWGSSKTHPNTEEIKNLQKQIERLNCEELTVERKAEFLEVSKQLDDLLLK